MKVGVKFCGGCNPHYDRGKILQRIQSDFPEIELAPFKEKDLDIVLVICGCEVACASHNSLIGKSGKIVITRPEDYDRLRYLLSSYARGDFI